MVVFANADNGGTRNVCNDRYRLIDGLLLRRLMDCPDAGGDRHTVRSLAAASGVGKSKISNMLHDRQTEVTRQQASAIAEAVGARRKGLFLPSTFAFANETEEETK